MRSLAVSLLILLPAIAGGWFELRRREVSAISTHLPGTLDLVRSEGGRETPVADLDRLPAGTYRIRYTPPAPPRGVCPLTVTVATEGLLGTDTPSPLVAGVAEHYRTEVLPGVLEHLGETCAPGESLEVRIELRHGVVVQPDQPERIHRIGGAEEPAHAILGRGEPVRYLLNQPFVVGCGEHLELVEQGVGTSVAAR